MGGLISRRYISAYMGSRDINQLVMIATPNGGSHTADILAGVAGTNQLLRELARKYIDKYREPAIVELTTPYLTGFNIVNTNRKGVPFYAVAGKKCLPQNPLEPLPNDIIVATSSMRAIALTRSWDYPSFGLFDTSCDAEHSTMMKSDTIFDKYVTPRLKGMTVQLSGVEDKELNQTEEEAVVQPEPSQLTIPQTATLQSGGSVEFPYITEAISRTSFIVAAPTDFASVKLRAPDGKVYDPQSTQPGVTYFDSTSSGMPLLTYTVENPIPGQWTILVEPIGSIPAEGVPVFSVRSFYSKTKLQAEIPATESVFGSKMTVAARLTSDGKPLLGSVSGQLLGPDDSNQAIVLLDDGQHGDGAAGDGLYGYTFTPPQIGVYTASLNARVPSTATSSVIDRSTVWGASVVGEQVFLPAVVR